MALPVCGSLSPTPHPVVPWPSGSPALFMGLPLSFLPPTVPQPQDSTIFLSALHPTLCFSLSETVYPPSLFTPFLILCPLPKFLCHPPTMD